MKTTFDIPEPLLREVQKLAKDRKTTMKSLVEQALRALLDQQPTDTDFVLPDKSVHGSGLQTAFADATWDQVRAAAYGSPE